MSTPKRRNTYGREWPSGADPESIMAWRDAGWRNEPYPGTEFTDVREVT